MFFFKSSKYDLLPTSSATLDRLITMLNNNSTMEIKFGGHTNNSGSSELNVELSLKRVESVKQYLVNKGVASSRIKTKGYGSAKPIASNQTKATRKLNRRVEFTILKN